MKVLLDTNIVLDVLLKRYSFYQNSFAIFRLIDQERIYGCISATSINDIFYIARKELKDAERVYQAIENLIDLFTVVQVRDTTIASALALRWNDFEDALQYIAAKENGVAYIITRDTTDYESADIPCISPADFMAYLKET